MWPRPGRGTVGAAMSTSAATLPNRPARAPAWHEAAVDIVLTAVSAAVTLGTIGTERGLVGMRERAALAGGRLEAAGAHGAFRVRAELPLRIGRA